MPYLKRTILLTSFSPSHYTSIITPAATIPSLLTSLQPYVDVKHPTATYYLGMIMCYCTSDILTGVRLLANNTRNDIPHAQSLYSLGLLIRDCNKAYSSLVLNKAAKLGYLPALQEILTQKQMKDLHGEPSHVLLKPLLLPQCLARVMKKHYVSDVGLRGVSKSHCWNTGCGRWAFKARGIEDGGNGDDGDDGDDGDATNTTTTTTTAANTTTTQNSINTNPSTPTMSPITSPQKTTAIPLRVSRMKMCSSCQRAKYCSKLCQVSDWRSGRHKRECGFIGF
jgi:hypothetical protein